ncbi:hypothetical protein M231_06007 [Tremella mesenterica]|uniref:Uncharacterized protein n=1 Tax=Tremella mesenterica TaxID=5217 RepID=A0A4Q1BGM0_TREME|nr:hypothetical protein M231_06007 [Tremella mesenterica]
MPSNSDPPPLSSPSPFPSTRDSPPSGPISRALALRHFKEVRTMASLGFQRVEIIQTDKGPIQLFRHKDREFDCSLCIEKKKRCSFQCLQKHRTGAFIPRRCELCRSIDHSRRGCDRCLFNHGLLIYVDNGNLIFKQKGKIIPWNELSTLAESGRHYGKEKKRQSVVGEDEEVQRRKKKVRISLTVSPDTNKSPTDPSTSDTAASTLSPIPLNFSGNDMSSPIGEGEMPYMRTPMSLTNNPQDDSPTLPSDEIGNDIEEHDSDDDEDSDDEDEDDQSLSTTDMVKRLAELSRDLGRKNFLDKTRYQKIKHKLDQVEQENISINQQTAELRRINQTLIEDNEQVNDEKAKLKRLLESSQAAEVHTKEKLDQVQVEYTKLETSLQASQLAQANERRQVVEEENVRLRESLEIAQKGLTESSITTEEMKMKLENLQKDVRGAEALKAENQMYIDLNKVLQESIARVKKAADLEREQRDKQEQTMEDKHKREIQARDDHWQGMIMSKEQEYSQVVTKLSETEERLRILHEEVDENLFILE